jgi:hypothetical protein
MRVEGGMYQRASYSCFEITYVSKMYLFVCVISLVICTMTAPLS